MTRPIRLGLGSTHKITEEQQEKERELIAIRIASSKKAKEAFEFIKILEEESLSKEYFWEKLKYLIDSKTFIPENKKDTREIKSHAWCKNFEKMLLTFGKHEGKSIGDVSEEDISYLEWLSEVKDEFKLNLKLYLRSFDRHQLSNHEIHGDNDAEDQEEI